MVTIIVCMFFAAISGSAVATVSAVGAFMIPEMVSHGYNKPFSAALTAAAGTIGVIIPPSIPFVIYGVVSGTSITDLFTAGFLPGSGLGEGYAHIFAESGCKVACADINIAEAENTAADISPECLRFPSLAPDVSGRIFRFRDVNIGTSHLLLTPEDRSQ